MIKKWMMVILCVRAWASVSLAGLFGPEVQPVDLRCEYRRQPLGIDQLKPRLSWRMEVRDQKSEVRGIKQTAYRVLVATSEKLLKAGKADLWDSGQVASDQSMPVAYQGQALASGQRCCWKVKTWTTAGAAWSQPACWTMGLLKPEDWSAKWVKPRDSTTAPWLRKEFTLAAAPEQALAYVNVKGYCELYVNGQKVGADVLSPAVTVYAKRTRYNTYDIRQYLRPGKNCVGAWLGLGLWYRRGEANPEPVPLARIQLAMTVQGRPVVVGTDTSWTWLPSTHTEHWWDWNGNGREETDMRRNVPDWNQAGGATGAWQPVVEHPERTGVATAQACPPNRITKTFPLGKCTVLNTNTVELDFGTNLNGWLKLRLPPLKAGDKVTLYFADKRYQKPDGDDTPIGHIGCFPGSAKTFNTPQGPVVYQTMNQRAEYIADGKPGEEYCGRFNYFSFRYVIVEGLPAPPQPEDAQALMIESDLAPAGDFECSDALLNRIYQVNLWTIRCLDLGGYMVDCPHRERMGYGDGQTSIDTQIMSRDAAAFYAKWTVDWLDVQDPATGKTANFAPKNDDPSCWFLWGGLIVVLPWKTYLYYGDRRLLAQAYDQMVLYPTQYIESFYPGGGLDRQGGDTGGDWVTPRHNMSFPPGTELFANCYRVYLYDLLAKSAAALGKAGDVKKYRDRADRLRTLIHARYYKPAEQLYDSGRELDQALPLLLGIVPKALKPTVEQKLEEIILVKNQGHLDTGMLGTLFLLDALRQMGRNDLACTMARQTTFPGWGYLLSQGQTTFGEQWDAYWSQIHSCFLSPGGWMAQGLAGILPDEAAPGFKHIVIKPAIADGPPAPERCGAAGLTWVKCHYDSMYGRIVSNWKRENAQLTMDITVPPNTTATVYVPTKGDDQVTESGQPADRAAGVRSLRRAPGATVYEVGSGRYRFESRP